MIVLGMLFAIKFRTQILRIRPGLLSYLDNTVAEAVKISGGKIIPDHRRLCVTFEERPPGFWLDILNILETILKVVEEVFSELYGYTCIVGYNPNDDGKLLIRSVPTHPSGTGIWCSPSVQDALSPYVAFDPPLEGIEQDSPLNGYAQLKCFKIFSDSGAAGSYALRQDIEKNLKEGAYRNILLAGPAYIGKRDCLFKFCTGFLRGPPPLVIRFGSGGTGVGCFADALNDGIRALIADCNAPESLEQLDALGVLLSRDRFRDEYPAYLIQQGGRFLQLLLDAYIRELISRGKTPLIILENLQEANSAAGGIILEVYRHLSNKKSVVFYGTWSTESKEADPGIDRWNAIFSRTLYFSTGKANPPQIQDIPMDLVEVAYTAGLFGRYFPGTLSVELFKEGGKNPAIILRAFSLLSYWGIIDFIEDPRPRISNFMEKAENLLGKQKEYIWLMVRNRLLDCVQKGKIRPCFNLLKTLSDLGWERSDELIMEAIQGDISQGTLRAIERALEGAAFSPIVGSSRAPTLRYIYKTSKALIHGEEVEIKAAFKAVSGDTAIPAYEAKILTNRAIYFLSERNIPAAMDAAKEAMIISQGNRAGSDLAQAYRIFSLVNLSNKNINDAAEYVSFAIELAEKNQNLNDLGLTAFYGAVIYYLHGNLAKAEKLTLQATDAALSAGRIEWAERARFFLGRLYVEMGRYEDALNIFESLQHNLSGYKKSEAEQSLSAWINRVNFFLQIPARRTDESLTKEALLFEIEAAFLTGDYDRVLRYSERLLNFLPAKDFLFIEQPDWRSAYAQCELLILPLGEFFFRFGSIFRALALSRLPPDQGGNQAEALRIIQELLKNDRFAEFDPHNAFYSYAYYLILKELNTEKVDVNTAISIAFKRLQRRAGHIDDVEVRRSFLFKNYWNGALSQVAKLYNLI
jgi:tetratricopeptide (TPR) repeat protein